jgi:hypothetical protein
MTTNFLLEAYNTENKQVKPLIDEIEDVIQKELFPIGRDGI